MGHPYQNAPDFRRWSRAFSSPVDPVVSFPFRITPNDKVATAGSCFAQHIGRYLRRHGYTCLDVEPPHPALHEKVRARFGYGIFSARFGNIYTSRQLVQLVRRADGDFQPVEDVWHVGGRPVDPFRPTIQPDGFASIEEFRADRAQHLVAVRRMLETLDVFVFTLGLTECWASREDGAVFPVCPGVAGGDFDPERHAFLNLTVDEVVSDLNEFVTRLRASNKRARVVLTVSPVPLMATAEDRHVLTATTYSKAVLRVAAEMIARRFDDVGYFPSFEIITGQFNRGRYFADDLRSVTEEGVEHVMSLFFRHVGSGAGEMSPVQAVPDTLRRSQQIAQALCDEELLDSGA